MSSTQTPLLLSPHHQFPNAEEEEEVQDAEEEEEVEEFSFVCEVASSPISAEDAFINGQIKPLLLFSTQDYHNLPMHPPVKNLFVQTPPAQHTNTNCTHVSNLKEASPDVCKKSNSTGFSKIWRFKDFLGRSNSDGRDAFIFLNNDPSPKSPPPPSSSTSNATKVKPTKKGNKPTLSPHEIYLKNKAKDDDRRRSFLPYRPELMGFFTSVNGGGLSKNLHPY